MWQVDDHLSLDYGGFILVPVPIFQLSGLVTHRTTDLTQAKALSTSSFSSYFLSLFPPASKKRMEILLSPPFVTHVFIETFFIVFYSSSHIRF